MLEGTHCERLAVASGFLALLDDISVLARSAAASVDDLATQAVKASAKSLGVVIDDAAVTPQYVRGVSPKRELAVIKRITLGSLRNKFLFILPAAMVFTTWAPWVLPIFLICGGLYLAFEGAEKVLGWFGVHLHGEGPKAVVTSDPNQFENQLVSGAVRTDLILSAEIMLITLANVTADGFWNRLGVLAIVALMMTALVYGVVAILVKLDDIGLAMVKHGTKLGAALGNGIVKAMPGVFSVISVVGTIAMLWVGGHIVVQSLFDLGWSAPHDALSWVADLVRSAGGVVVWLADTFISAVIGIGLGLIAVLLITSVHKLRTGAKVASDQT